GGRERVVEPGTVLRTERGDERCGFGIPMRDGGDVASDAPRSPIPTAGEVPELERVPGALEDLRVAERDLAPLAGREGEDAGAEEAMPRQLDEGGVPLAANDLFIDLPGALGIHGLAAQLLIPLEEREVGEHGLARERVEVIRLVEGASAVLEPLLDLDAGDAVRDLDRDRGAQPDHRGAGPLMVPHLDPALGVARGGREERGGERERRGDAADAADRAGEPGCGSGRLRPGRSGTGTEWAAPGVRVRRGRCAEAGGAPGAFRHRDVVAAASSLRPANAGSGVQCG